MTNPKITVIIPVYNAEKYLYSCLNSVSEQSLNDIEIICVDDHSTDSSPEILLNIAKEDARVSVITHNINKGEGASRNTGLDSARGDYVFHLDADDSIPVNALETLHHDAVKYNSDMVKGRYNIIHEDGKIEQLDWSTPDSKVINTNIYASKFLQKIPTSHCTYLYKREFLNLNNIRYRTDLVIGLDLIALATALVNASTITLIQDVIYRYFQSDESAIRGGLSVDVANDAIRTKEIIADLLNENGLHEAAIDYLQAWAYIIDTHWTRMPSSLTLEECRQSFSIFRTLISDNNIVPWTINTPGYYRYILALVLAEQDVSALTFLGSSDISKGFSSKEQLIEGLEFILEQVPNDTGTLIELGHIARKNGDLKCALDLFEKAVKYSNGNFGANLQAATILKELGRYEEARTRLDNAQEIITRELSSYDLIKQVTTIRDNLNRTESAFELNSVRSELNQAHKELQSVRNELNQAHAELLSVRNELHQAHEELLSVRNKLHQAHEERQGIRSELSLAHKDLHTVRKKLDLVYASTSWKITKPLRKIMTSLKRNA